MIAQNRVIFKMQDDKNIGSEITLLTAGVQTGLLQPFAFSTTDAAAAPVFRGF